MTLVAGVDSSTQSCTVVLYDAQTRALVGTGSAPHPPVHPPASEQHPEDWWTALGQALTAACADAGRSPGEIAAISVAAQHHGLVVLDAAGQVIRPAKLWNDTTSAPQAARLAARLDRAEWVRKTGSVPTAAFTITKLAWLAENEPESFVRMRRVMLPHDWLTLQLCGEAVSDRGDSSGTGYFDPHTNTWQEDLLALVDPDRDWSDHLPRMLGPSEQAGRADTARAAALGLDPSTVVGPGSGDQGAAVMGLGLGAGDTMIAFGTSGVVTAVSDTPVTHASGAFNGTASGTGTFQPIAVTLNAARITDTFTRWLGADHTELTRLALSAWRTTAARPTLVSFFDGERTPDRPTSRGLLADLTNDTTREQLALSAYEGVVFGLLAGWETMIDSGLDVTGRLIVTGGASRSQAYRTVLAGLAGRPVHSAHLDGGLASARGAAVQAAGVLRGGAMELTVRDWDPGDEVVAVPADGDAEYAAAVSARYREVAALDQLDRSAAP